jgi:hypothetical protein
MARLPLKKTPASDTPPARRARPIATEARGLQGAPSARQTAEMVVPGGVGGASAATRLVPLDRQRVYDAMVEELKDRYQINVRRWRKAMSGVAYELKYRHGVIKRLITAPRPRSPVSASIFLHEVGHHAIGFKRYSPRCLEEYYVWQWALREMIIRGIPVTQRVLRHYRRSMFHYARQARLLSPQLPREVEPFAQWPG